MATEPNVEQTGNPTLSPSSKNPEDSNEFNVPDGLRRLGEIRSRIRLLGSFIAGIALASIFSIGTGGLFAGYQAHWVYLVGILIHLTGVVFLVSWERLKKDGLVLVEEISDEIEWDYRKRRQSADALPNGERAQRPELEVRVALRGFLRAAELPLAPEQYSTLVYAAYFVACVFATILIAIFNPRFPW